MQDVEEGVMGAELIPSEGDAQIIAASVTNATAQMDADRKTTGLKALQGCIWHGGFATGELKGELFRDVPDALQLLRNLGIKTYIYSSGSRQAQADLFGHTTVRSRIQCIHSQRHTLLLHFYTNSASTWILASVLPFSKLNKLFFGYFDPENVLLDNKNK